MWTGDPQRGLDIARRTRVGTFGINLYEPDLGSPWGGRGSSGSGSAYGPEGMDAYLTSKSVFLPSLRTQAYTAAAGHSGRARVSRPDAHPNTVSPRNSCY